LRPLFPKALHNETQVVVTVLSADQENDPDILAIIGASSALSISHIPFGGPVSATRVGHIDGEFALNPTFTQLLESSLDVIVVSTKDGVVMVEAEAKEVPEQIVLDAIKAGHVANQDVIALQDDLVRTLGKPKMEVKTKEINPDLLSEVTALLGERLGQGFGTKDRAKREATIAEIKEEATAKWGNGHSSQDISAAFDLALKKTVRALILDKGIRPDGRGLTDVRPIGCEVGLFPRVHGSGLFTRGLTQVLAITTLGSPGEVQKIDGIGQEEEKRFIHHYNFPPFSNGEVKRMGGPGRREIGHGALAERALLPVIPSEVDFPYTIRLVSEVLSSNGSTSMASVCSSSLSLMDAGVPIKTAVAGIAMGLVTGDDGRYAVLTDIQGMEDHLGDMDFKVAGTAEGVTALQMDIKVRSIDYAILEKGLNQAQEARRFILDRMNETLSANRPELNKFAPRLIKMTVDPEKIRHVIGPGGRTIRAITSEAKVTIDIDNDGTIIIGSPNQEATQKAISMIEEITREIEVGATYTGKVTRVMNFGAFVEILPGKEGLVHISELADYRAPTVEDVVKVGDEVMVMVTEIDRMGRINLSRRAVLQKQAQESGAPEGGERPDSPGTPPRRDFAPRQQQGPRPYRDDDSRGDRGDSRGGPPRSGPREGSGDRPRGPQPRRPFR
jgi:polyribonucleotide nucleotidyltransferase